MNFTAVCVVSGVNNSSDPIRSSHNKNGSKIQAMILPCFLTLSYFPKAAMLGASVSHIHCNTSGPAQFYCIHRLT